jgi:acyl-CoA thioester hydrolase
MKNEELRLKNELRVSKEFDIRFSEVDLMNIVWHGSYALYFEDAREEFGRVYGLSYQLFIENECPAPLVELNFRYIKPLLYGARARVDIFYRYTPAAKIVFDYEIALVEDNSLVTTGTSTQVFIDKNYNLMLTNPPFYEEWKKKYNFL